MDLLKSDEHFLSQGSFSEGLFAAFKPCSQEVENSEVPRDGLAGVGFDDEEDMEDAGDVGHGMVEEEAEAEINASETHVLEASSGGSQDEEGNDVAMQPDQPVNRIGAAAVSIGGGGKGTPEQDPRGVGHEGQAGFEAGGDSGGEEEGGGRAAKRHAGGDSRWV